MDDIPSRRAADAPSTIATTAAAASSQRQKQQQRAASQGRHDVLRQCRRIDWGGPDAHPARRATSTSTTTTTMTTTGKTTDRSALTPSLPVPTTAPARCRRPMPLQSSDPRRPPSPPLPQRHQRPHPPRSRCGMRFMPRDAVAQLAMAAAAATQGAATVAAPAAAARTEATATLTRADVTIPRRRRHCRRTRSSTSRIG
jgi:hypothetical protein